MLLSVPSLFALVLVYSEHKKIATVFITSDAKATDTENPREHSRGFAHSYIIYLWHMGRDTDMRLQYKEGAGSRRKLHRSCRLYSRIKCGQTVVFSQNKRFVV